MMGFVIFVSFCTLAIHCCVLYGIVRPHAVPAEHYHPIESTHTAAATDAVSNHVTETAGGVADKAEGTMSGWASA